MPANATHPAFRQPEDAEAPLWRYMDIAKYVSMLMSSALYFARMDKFDDPFEGSLSKAEFDKLLVTAAAGEASGAIPADWKGRYKDVLLANARNTIKSCYVCCWHANSHESEAMWKLYATSGCSIAIQTTYRQLWASLPNAFEPEHHLGPFLGMVTYLDHTTDSMPIGNIFHPVMHKRRSFEHERECRAVFHRTSRRVIPNPLDDSDLADFPTGISVPVDLSALVKRIVVSPSAPPWFSGVVEDLTHRYGFDFPVDGSSLVAAPYF
jgi:hypothetical protein